MNKKEESTKEQNTNHPQKEDKQRNKKNHPERSHIAMPKQNYCLNLPTMPQLKTFLRKTHWEKSQKGKRAHCFTKWAANKNENYNDQNNPFESSHL